MTELLAISHDLFLIIAYLGIGSLLSVQTYEFNSSREKTETNRRANLVAMLGFTFLWPAMVCLMIFSNLWYLRQAWDECWE